MEDKKTWDEMVQETARCLKEKEKDGGVASEIIKEQEKKIKMLRIFSGIAAKKQCICPMLSKRKPWVFKKQARNNSRACFLYNYLEFLILAVIQ